MDKEIKECWLRDGCPCRTGACYSCQPTDDGCPVYRWFRDRFIVRCKDCVHYHPGFCCDLMQKPIMTDAEWYCANGERRADDT